jgi:hypothetical protein
MTSGTSKKKLQIDSRELRWIFLSNIYSQMKNPQIKEQMTSDKTICSIFNKNKNILLHDLESKQKPIQLMFAPSYGQILDYKIMCSGYLIVLFEYGQVSQLSLLNNELSQEINSKKLYNEKVTNFCWSKDKRLLIVNTGPLIKFFDVVEFKEIKEKRLRFGMNVKSIHMLNCNSALIVLLMNGELNSILSIYNDFKVVRSKNAHSVDIAVQKSYNVIQWVSQVNGNLENGKSLEKAVYISPDDEVVDFQLGFGFIFIHEKKKIHLLKRNGNKLDFVWSFPILKKIVGSTLTQNGNLILR